MRTLGVSLSVTGFLVLGALSLFYLFTTLGEFTFQHGGSYTVYADFTSASGLALGSPIEMAGVRIGQVSAIDLTGTRARVALSLHSGVQLQDDVIASIQTKGLLGERYLLLTPGGADEIIPPGGKIRETEAPLDLPSLLATYVALRNKAAANEGKAANPEQ
jgi:phospholipid/cholesterol/gamma-HCH transport system substrate-binding protein